MTLALDQTRTYHFDGLGSTIKLTDGSGVITDTFSYDAWGNVTRVSGSTSDNPYLYVGRLGYYTHYQEPSMNPLDQTSGTKLLQLGVRYYNPEIGRFTQRDPIKQIQHWAFSVYAEDNTYVMTDAGGLKPVNVHDDPALKKCLSRLSKCVKDMSCVIANVENRWYKDDAISGNAESDWVTVPVYPWNEGYSCISGEGVPQYRNAPRIRLKPGTDTSWEDRNNPERFDAFCMTVLHELIHVSHGWFLCTYRDAWKELWDPDYYKRQAEKMYNENCRRQ